jgi:acetate kinase
VDDADATVDVTSLAEAPRDVHAVGHRIVHGGPRFRDPMLVDDSVVAGLERLVELAPLHNRPALEALADARRAFPDVPHVAVFDTAFHATLPEDAYTYALPLRYRDELGIRRYGFHGLSVQWAASRVPVARLVVCHLGGGCSVTAVLDGRSVDTSMGFTPLDGVPMGTRPGSLDPGIVVHLLRTGVTVEELEQVLEHESGLLGLSRTSASVRQLEASDTASARLALAVFVRRIAASVAACATVLDGLDAIAFTGGVGEHSARVRADVCSRLGFMGVALDPQANETAKPDGDIGSASSPVRVVVVAAREDVVIAHAARQLIAD